MRVAGQAIETATDGRGSRATHGALVRETQLKAGQRVRATAEARRGASTTVVDPAAGTAGVLVVGIVVGSARSGAAASAAARIVEVRGVRAGKTRRAALLVGERVPRRGPAPPGAVAQAGARVWARGAAHPRGPVMSAGPAGRGGLVVNMRALGRVERRNGWPDDRRLAGRTRGAPIRPDAAETCRMW